MTADPAPRGDKGEDTSAATDDQGEQDSAAAKPTLNTAVRRRRTDRAFYIRLAGAIRQNERALERLKR